MNIPNDFPILRASLDPRFAQVDPDQLRALVQQVYGPGASPEDVESFFGSIGRGFQQAAGAVGRFAKQALPGIASGAAAGSMLGPWGALGGAIVGGAGSVLAQSRNPTARAIGGGINTAANVVSTVRGGGAGGALGALGSIAGGGLGAAGNPLAGRQGGGASQLMAMLARPEILGALQSSLLGSFGKPSVSVGGQPLPTHMLMSALGTVAQRAAHEMAEASGEAAESVPGFLSEAGEALGLDVEDAEGRADTLLTLLALSPAIWSRPPQSGQPVTVQVQPAAPLVPEPVGVAGNEAWDEQWADPEAWDENDEGQGIEAWESGEDWDAIDPGYWQGRNPVYG
jgi:hypothetical protein